VAIVEGLLLQWLQEPQAVDIVTVMADYCDAIRIG
jgi:hypothetical protein